MRAVHWPRYGRFALIERPDPEPGPGEVRLRIHAASLSSADWRVGTATVPPGFGLPMRLALGLRGPRRDILGTDGAGVIDAVGAGVTAWRPGDAVIAVAGLRFGMHAERAVLPEAGAIVAMPPGLSFVEAAALPFGGLTALHFLERAARLRAGERLLVVGASGAVGVAAVQIGRHLGASVAGVCSAGNAALVRDLGAARVFDHAREDALEAGPWDVILDAAGTVPPRAGARALAPGGRLLLVLAGLGRVLAAPLVRGGGRRAFAGPAPDRPDDLRRVIALARAGALRSVIDAVHPLDEFGAALARVASGRKRGAVILRLAPDAAAPLALPASERA